MFPAMLAMFCCQYTWYSTNFYDINFPISESIRISDKYFHSWTKYFILPYCMDMDVDIPRGCPFLLNISIPNYGNLPDFLAPLANKFNWKLQNCAAIVKDLFSNQLNGAVVWRWLIQTWANVDPDPFRYMAPLDHNEFITSVRCLQMHTHFNVIWIGYNIAVIIIHTIN